MLRCTRGFKLKTEEKKYREQRIVGIRTSQYDYR